MPAPGDHDSDARLGAPDHRHHHVPRGAGTFAMSLFLIALGVLFVASLVGYLLISLWMRQPQEIMQDGKLVTIVRDVPPIRLPHLLWLSTVIMIVSSVTMHRTLVSVQHERLLACRRWLTATLALAIAFVAVQAPSLFMLIREHRAALPDLPTAADPAFAQIGLIAALIIIHGLHVLGGIVPLFAITRRAHAGRYDHESYDAIRHIAMYWHFLDIVWLAMFATLQIAG